MIKRLQNNPIRLFNEIAPTYDLLNHLFSFNCDRRWREISLRAIEIPPKANILDVCTGTADIAIRMAEKYRSVKIYGVDLSEEMLKVGRTKISRKKFDHNIELIKADALHLPFSDGTFDILYISFGLRNLVDRKKGIQEMKRVLKENGQLVLLEFAPPQKSLFGRLYRLYLSKIIPFIGEIVSGSTSAYYYLHTSIEHFLEPEETVNLLKNMGFRKITCQTLMFGIVSLYISRLEKNPDRQAIPE